MYCSFNTCLVANLGSHTELAPPPHHHLFPRQNSWMLPALLCHHNCTPSLLLLFTPWSLFCSLSSTRLAVNLGLFWLAAAVKEWPSLLACPPPVLTTLWGTHPGQNISFYFSGFLWFTVLLIGGTTTPHIPLTCHAHLVVFLAWLLLNIAFSFHLRIERDISKILASSLA